MQQKKCCNFAFQGMCQETAVGFQKYQGVNVVGVELKRESCYSNIHSQHQKEQFSSVVVSRF